MHFLKDFLDTKGRSFPERLTIENRTFFFKSFFYIEMHTLTLLHLISRIIVQVWIHRRCCNLFLWEIRVSCTCAHLLHCKAVDKQHSWSDRIFITTKLIFVFTFLLKKHQPSPKKSTSFMFYVCPSTNPDHDERSPDIIQLCAVQLV
jgi:hypothetical protein